MATKNSKGNVEIFESKEVVSVHLAKYIADLSVKYCKKNGSFTVIDSEEAIAVHLAKYIAVLSDIYCTAKGSFTVVLSGGTMIHSLRKLVESPYKESVNWSKWKIFWLDERVVAHDDSLSNYKLAYDGFLSKVPIPRNNIYPINGDLAAKGEAEAAADDYEATLKNLVKTKIIELSHSSGFPKFDLQLLGIGPDGHVASLFPGFPQVHEKKRWVTSVLNPNVDSPKRMTFTFPVINSSSEIAVVVVGADRADAVSIVLGDKQPPNDDLLPAQRVSPEGPLIWFVDNDAASKL